MTNRISLLAIMFFVLLATGCSSVPDKRTVQQDRPVSRVKSDPTAAKQKIYSQYQEWQGTKHQMGGLSKDGIDCSGLVYLTYRQMFGVDMPRSTKHQVEVGESISRSKLQAGDLVFFKTGFKSRHVGIYIESDKFLHVSSSKGVMISKLTDYYWKDKYWHSRRVVELN